MDAMAKRDATATTRRSPRASVDLEVELGNDSRGRCLDLSARGMRLRSQRHSRCGDAVCLELDVGPSQRLALEGRVVWTRSNALRDSHVCGLAFDEQGDRHRLLEHLVACLRAQHSW